MKIEALMPDMERLEKSIPELTPEWHSLLMMSHEDRVSEVCRQLRLHFDSLLYRHIQASDDSGVFVPKKRTLKKKAAYFEFCIAINARDMVWFACPVHDRLSTTLTLPDSFMRIISHLGQLHFGRHGAGMIWPSEIESLANSLNEFNTARCVTPFFNYGTGDYECWINEKFDESYLWDHESSKLALSSRVGFEQWLETHYEKTIDSNDA